MARRGLMEQDLSKFELEVGKLHPLTPEVISRQATINIGTIGHVAHRKCTVVKAISGVPTVRFKNELERNITIKPGPVDVDGEQHVGALPPRGVVGSDHGGGVLDGCGPGGVCEVEQHGAVAGAAVLRPHGRALPGGRDGTTSRSGWTRAAASAASTR
ncbi:hypothetical protein PVAP13_8KG082400 [Panicum virgatum]|nr:hypothetical protein PVAP13_8KG082400 [Panicum virgatum]